MDDLVRQALAKWPDVPDCTGWLALDARGRWRAGDGTAGPRMPITHAPMIAFINRNYLSAGRYWLFQNGPQRVFVELEYTPFVWRLHPREHGTWELMAHTGVAMNASSVWLDDAGRFVVEARTAGREPIVGVVHDHDTALMAELLHDQDGVLLDDEAIARLTTDEVSDATPWVKPDRVAHLHLSSTDGAMLPLPVHRIASAQVAAQFGFEPNPAVALRVDLDTRR